MRFYRHCGEGWEYEMSAKPGTHGTHNGTHNDQYYESKIIALIKENNKITRKQMAAELSLSLRTVQRIINSMDTITFIGSGRGGHWEITD